MNLRLSAILVGALLLSLALLWLPEPVQRTGMPAAEASAEARAPELTIMDASVRSFGDDGALNWSMQSPRIAYHLSGDLEFASPSMLLQGVTNANLRVNAGQGRLRAADERETVALYAQVDASLIRSERSAEEVKFKTALILISQEGRQISAPDPVEISTQSIDTSAAHLELNLDRQLLLLGSSEARPVTTRIQPVGLFE